MKLKAVLTFLIIGIVVSAAGMHQAKMARQVSRVVFEAAHRHNWFWTDGWIGLFLEMADNSDGSETERDIDRLTAPFEASKEMTDCFSLLQGLGDGQDEKELVHDFASLFEISETRARQLIWIGKHYSGILPDLEHMMVNTSRGSQYSQEMINLLRRDNWSSKAEEYRQIYKQMRDQEKLYSQSSFRISEKADRYYFFFLTSLICFIGLFFLGLLWGYHIKAHARLTKAQNYTSSIINSMPSVIIGVDLDGIITHWNFGAQRLTGISSAKAVSKPLGTVVPRLADEMASVEDAVQSSTVHFESRHPYVKDGKTHYEDITVFPLMTEGAEGAVIRLDDVTEKVHMEEVMIQSEKMVSVGRLAGGVAHDLNNLLSPIIGYGELLIEDFEADDKRLESLGQILRAGLRARDLVGQLLAFSRKQPLKYKPLNMNTVLTDYQKLLRHSIREDVEIDIITTSKPCVLMADVGQIEQVIMNLAVNAQDAMPEGGKLTFKISTRETVHETGKDESFVSGKGRCLVLTVSDTGCGMDDDTQANLFEPFYSTKGNLGTGLGLAMVYGIIKQHDGDIQFNSEPGEGTVFTVYLPLTDEPCIEDEAEVKVTHQAVSTETILLVEDDEMVCQLAHTILKRCGYTVLLAECGPDALVLLDAETKEVDLLLTDVVMPGMNGKELFLEASSRYPKLKVLFMSGYNDDVIAGRGVVGEEMKYLQKPFSVKDLVEKVRQVLDTDAPAPS